MNLPNSLVFQQDFAPPHSSRLVGTYSNKKLLQLWIGSEGPIPWPPKSPDVTALDFFLWDYVKNFVFTEEITSLSHVKEISN